MVMPAAAPAASETGRMNCPRCHQATTFAKRKLWVPKGAHKVECSSCGAKLCSDCRRVWDLTVPGNSKLHRCVLGLEQVDMDDCMRSIEMSLQAAEFGCKRCPGCGEGAVKEDEDSCDHMTCFNCDAEWCWSCKADRNKIKAHGNHYHEESCRFYSAYEGPDAVKYQKDCKFCLQSGKPCAPPRKPSLLALSALCAEREVQRAQRRCDKAGIQVDVAANMGSTLTLGVKKPRGDEGPTPGWAATALQIAFDSPVRKACAGCPRVLGFGQ